MADAAIETGEQGGGLVGDDGGFEIGAGEGANGVEGVPVGLDDDFDFVFGAAKRDLGSQVARDAAQFGHNVFGKVFEIFGQLRLVGASGPAAQDCSGWRCKGRSRSGRLVADDDVPGANLPFLGEAVDDIRVFAGEGFNFALVVYVENEQGAVDGFGERAGENEFAAFAGFAGKAQMFFAERDSARDHVVDQFVEQGVVVHRGHLFDVLA